MYYCRPVVRSPSVVRAARHASVFPMTPFFQPRAAPATNELEPFFRILNDFAAPLAPAYANHARQTLANFGVSLSSPGRSSFTPSFDVKEVGSSYELRGDVPGFDGSDIDVEFTDAQTLVIRGRTERQTSSQGAPPVDAAKAIPENAPAEGEVQETNDDNASTYSTGSYQKPTVEEGEAEAGGAVAESSSDAQARADPHGPAQQEASQPVNQEQEQEQDQSRYWFQERSTGSFQRVFKFESRVDQDAVKASLKNGILSILVPKAMAPAARRINVD